MGKKDTGGKYLLGQDPDGWVQWLLGDPSLRVTGVLTSEFQFVARRGDSLLQVMGDQGEFCILSELQLRHEAQMPARLQNYCALARQSTGLNVVPIVVYLTPPPQGVEIATFYHVEYMGLVTHQDFKVIKMWEVDAREVERYPISLLPYVPLMKNVDETIVIKCAERIRAEPNGEELETILALFANMTMDSKVVERLLRWNMELATLEKSPIYQHILNIGVEQGLEQGVEFGQVRSIMQVLHHRFGMISADYEQRLLDLSSGEQELMLDAALLSADLDTFEAELSQLE